jgi:5-methyltetrahydropteroyltriglutamate--homocysteine methyltransferase
MINRAFANRPSSLHLAMHLCRGNNQSGWFGEGGYDPVAEVLFNKINVDSYFLEYETERAGGFEPLRFVPKNKTVVLGLVSSKLPQLESKDMLKRRIDEAAKYIVIDQLALSPQCGFASSTEGNRLSEEEQFAKLRLVVEVANEVWGQETGTSRMRRAV